MAWLCLLIGHRFRAAEVHARGYGYLVTDRCERVGCSATRHRSLPVRG